MHQASNNSLELRHWYSKHAQYTKAFSPCQWKNPWKNPLNSKKTGLELMQESFAEVFDHFCLFAPFSVPGAWGFCFLFVDFYELYESLVYHLAAGKYICHVPEAVEI